MNRLLLFAVLSTMILTMTSCDVIDGDPRETPTGPVDTNTIRQNVLLEDYTGHTCPNCPAATEIADQIVDAFGDDRVFVVAVHAGPFAVPRPPKYALDLRTPEGTELDNTFKNSRIGNPNGLINRVTAGDRFVYPKEMWSTAVADLLDNTPTVNISIKNKTFTESTKTLTFTAEINYLEAGSSDYHIVAWITEDGMIGTQTDNRKTPSDVENYVFKHVLRGSINGTWGEQLSQTDVPLGTKISKDFSFTFPANKDWVPENCDLIVYVHRHATTKEVLQVVKTEVK